jgi:hypothetical protein
MRWLLPIAILAGCTAVDERPAPVDAGVVDAVIEASVTPSASVVAEGAPAFCHRPGSDRVRDVFCVADAPVIDSLHGLQRALRVGAPAFEDPDTEGDHVSILLAHSTALSGHLISSINPRAIILGPSATLAFQRGVQQVEVAASARDVGGVNLYLFVFEQACNATGCTPSDLYSPRIERDWRKVTVQDDEDLKNTPQDCRQCHQRALARPTLLMRELRAPWTHFFDPDRSGVAPGVRGAALVDDYLAAHGDDAIAGLDQRALKTTVGFDLEANMPKPQPLLFDAPAIEDERWPYRDGGFASSPLPSPTWEAAFEAFKRGEQLALPYLEVRASDPAKLARLSEAYLRFRTQGEPLPELSDIFPDDPLLRARIGLSTEPSASAPEALVQACGSCHNDVLDQTITRARFNIGRMNAQQRALAIERIERRGPGVMPPPEARQLTSEARTKVITFLRGDADDPLLQHAAEHGMAGGAGE